MPRAISSAKEAISYANSNPSNYYAKQVAEIKIEAADYWAGKCKSRKNWRTESNIKPDHSSSDYYKSGPTVIWELNH